MSNRPISLKAETAREYREKFDTPEIKRIYGKTGIPTKTLARILYSENKLLYKNEEDARNRLKYIEGKNGSASLKNLGKRGGKFLMTQERVKNPYSFPASDEATYKPYMLKGHKRVAIFSDIHVPYHSIAALTAAFDFCKKEKPDAIILNGDCIDCHTLSKFVKDPKARNFKLELDTFKEFFTILHKTFGCKIYYKLGNHEERYEIFLKQHPEVYGLPEFELENILKARADGIEVIKDKRPIYAGNLTILHGHEFGGGQFSPVNIAKGLFNKAISSCIQGHNHQISSHTQPTVRGKNIGTWSMGCLCELHPAYLPLNKWAHGFGIVDISGEDFQVRNYTIDKDKIY